MTFCGTINVPKCMLAFRLLQDTSRIHYTFQRPDVDPSHSLLLRYLKLSSSWVFLPPFSYITLQFQSGARLATSSPSPPFFVSSACTLSSSSLVLPLSLLEAR